VNGILRVELAICGLLVDALYRRTGVTPPLDDDDCEVLAEYLRMSRYGKAHAHALARTWTVDRERAELDPRIRFEPPWRSEAGLGLFQLVYEFAGDAPFVLEPRVERLVERTAETFALPTGFELSELQRLQRDLVDVVDRAHEADERTRTAFASFLLALATREADEEPAAE
jgi:hypothetical protein